MMLTFRPILTSVAVAMLLGWCLRPAALADTSPTPDPSPHVVINEIMWAGDEYVELYNYGSDPVDVSGWQLLRQKTEADAMELIVTIDPNKTIPAGGFFLLSAGGTTTIPADNSLPAHKLIDDGELLILQDTLESPVDTANQFGRWFFPLNSTGQFSMERGSPTVTGKDASNWHTSTGVGGGRNGTPRAANSSGVPSPTPTPNPTPTPAATPTPTASVEPDVVYPRTIKINEVLPNPAGSDSSGEYIELKNTGSDVVPLSGWQLDDGEGGSSPFILSAVSLAAGEIKYFLSSVTHLSLTNSGDTARILDPNGETADTFSYTGSQEAVSWNRLDDGTFAESTTLTPGEANIITPPEDSSGKAASSSTKKSSTKATTGKVAGASVTVTDLDKVRGLNDGVVVTTQGVVSSPPNVVGAHILYVAGSGIRVVLPKTFSQKLSVGDVIQLTGQLGTSYTERRILVSANGSVVKLKAGPAPVPHEVKTAEIGSIWEGSLVHMNGPITKLDGATIYMNDGSGEARVVIEDSTGITRPALKRGVQADVVGEVSRTSSGYRVLPRFSSDLTFGSAASALVATKIPKPKVMTVPKGRITEEAAFTCAPWPSNSPTASPAACKTVTVVAKQLDNRWVFLGCLIAMALLVRGFQKAEPLLASR